MSEVGVGSDVPSVAGTLLQARTAAGLSQREVADALFLTVDMIAFLDAGEYDRLPNQAFVRGYLRSYARLVGLDPNQLIRQFDEESRQAEPNNLEPPAPKSVMEPRFSGVVQAGLISLGLIAVLVFAVLMFSSEEEPLRSTSAEISTTKSNQSNSTPQVQLEVGPNEAEASPVIVPVPGDSESPKALPRPGSAVIEEGLAIEEEAVIEEDATSLDEFSPVSPELDASGAANGDLTPEAGSEIEEPNRSEESSERGSESTMVISSAISVAAPPGETLGVGNGLVGSSSEGLSASDGEYREATINVPEVEPAVRVDESAPPNVEDETRRFGLDSRPGALGSVSISREDFDGGRRIWVDAGGSDELTAELSDACWIEVADGQGERIYGDLNRAGDALIISGRAPLEVLLGNAPVVSLAFNGEPVDLARRTTPELTARVTLGN